MSASSVIFKGSGFYSTDYRDTGYLEAKKKDNNEPAKAEAKPAASAETAPKTTETNNSAAPKPEAKAAAPAKDNSSNTVSQAAA